MPALALADALRDMRDDVEPVLVGARRGVEATLLPVREPRYRFHLLPVEPIHRRQWWKNVKWLPLLPRLRTECLRILREERPRLAVGTGGYASGPILYYAYRSGVPLALQEQNAYPGITTRLLARRARQIHLGFAEAKEHLRPGPHAEVFALGNPIVPPDSASDARTSARNELGIDTNAVVCFVMGGSQGARRINSSLAAAITRGRLDNVVILWSTGPSHFARYQQLHAPPLRQLRPFWDPVATAYAACDLVVARAGAMSTAELCAWGLPAVLIPLPTAAADHQTVNAIALEAAGAAVMVQEYALADEGEVLSHRIRKLAGDRTGLRRMSEAARARGRPQAARQIAERLLTLVN
jgi:UDP-N-acetylglucosamine--N-acetylmuramyl-(pentapeptide) pyrophosphoryl-undecaprenol N-acetylglucosamine transferase